MENLDNSRAEKDPVYFINEYLGMPLHPGQVRYLEMAVKAIENPGGELIRKFILVCANRWGKSALISCLQLWYLFFKHGIRTDSDEEWFDIEYRTGNIAPVSALTEPVFKAMKQIMTSSYPIRDQKTGKITTNKCKIEWFFLEDRTINTPPFKLYFANNSYIENLSLMGNKGDSLQGKPYGIITYDEAARSDHLQLEIDDAITGRLLDWTAPLHLLSTPAQDSASLLYYNDLYKEGLVGNNASYTQEGSIYENSFMTKEQIAEHEKLQASNPLKDQVLHGKFIFGTRTIFPGADILAAEDESLNHGVRYQDKHRYVLGIDTAIGSDEFVTTIIDITKKPYQVVWIDAAKGNSRSPQLHLNTVCNLVDNYRNGNNLQILLETYNGESVRFYHDLPPYIKVLTRTYGAWQPDKVRTDNENPHRASTTKVQKADLIVNLQKLLASKQIKIPKADQQLIRQLSIYKEDDKRIPTDRVISLALAAWLAEDTSKVLQPAFQTIDW